MSARDILPEYRIAVVGAGAIGGYYGAKLAHHGRDVHFLMRGDLHERRQLGWRVQGGGEDFHVAPLNCSGTTEEIGPCDLVLIAVKATSNGDLLQLIPPLLQEKTILLTLQNGLGNEEFLAANFGAERVIGGLCFVCLNRTSPGVIEHYDHGRVVLGEYGGEPQLRTHAISAEFASSGVVCSVAENLGLERWRKLVWNIPFNGLAITAGGVDTAVIMGDEQLRAKALALMEEVITAANRCGYPLPMAVAREQMKRTDTMGAYKPSTLIDFEAGKPLEIEAIWGEPLRRARAAGCEMPQLAALLAELEEIAGTRLVAS